MDSKAPAQLYLDSEKDELFERGPWPKPFAFNEEVVRVFDDMVSRSVPMYREVVACAAHWAKDYHQPHTRIVDVGCSTGTFLELLGRFLKSPAILVGLDNAQPMIDKAREKLAHIASHHKVELHCLDANLFSFADSSVVVMNYTLQFLPINQRTTLLRSVFDGLLSGGLLFLSEKVKCHSPHFQETITRHYEAFKERNGYARSEIERKKEALEHVLIPLSQDEQLAMLHDAGFREVDILLKMHGFTTFVARKTTPETRPL